MLIVGVALLKSSEKDNNAQVFYKILASNICKSSMYTGQNMLE